MQSFEEHSLNKLEDSSAADLLVAGKVHAAMIPEILPVAEELEIRSFYAPCKRIGGDLFDVVQISENIIAFMVIDVAGYGVQAALMSATAKISFSTYMKAGFSPGAAVEQVNADIRRLSLNCFITAFLGYLDLHDNKLTYCNAGHPYPVIYRRSQNSIEMLKTQGTLVGVLEDGFFEERFVYLNPGDCLLMFTDGVYHCFSDNEFPERCALEKSITETLYKGTPDEFIGKIRSKCINEKDENRFEDDITALAVEILTLSRKNQIKEKLGFSMDDPVYLQFLRYYEDMDRAIAVILSNMDSCGYTDDAIRKMKISLTELLVNAILHGNKKDYSKKVIMGHIVDKSSAIISIMDEGSGFDPATVPDPTLPDNLVKDCGRGLFIVRHYVDNMIFNDNGNRVTVIKYHK
ncbi:MAG TPA: SpoIIE family protein phosphatase [Chitinispirillaceae bacterium]|nr:SpoIIE family protein phosphatase [Chitinispirillaceae bacterium]